MPRRAASLAVFCGSAAGHRPDYRQAAETLGRELARRGVRLVYGGGRLGLMGVLAQAAVEGGAEVIGVIPEVLQKREAAHFGLKQLHVVESMHQRKALMAELADAFLVLPGGYGTLDELCEVLTWNQLGLYSKPVGLLNVAGYFDCLLAFLDQAVIEGFLTARARALLTVDRDIPSLLDRIIPRHGTAMV